jgi:hypothetical protein
MIPVALLALNEEEWATSHAPLCEHAQPGPDRGEKDALFPLPLVLFFHIIPQLRDI